jgi:dTDP-4-amino-4,6-dideoxygalactose transaminase
MTIKRTLPPAAAPLSISDIANGIVGLVRKKDSFNNLEKSIKEQFDVSQVFFVSSGKAAITVTLLSLAKIHPERKLLIIPSFNCYSVPSAIYRAGLTVVPCDIDLGSLSFNMVELEKLLERHSDQVLAVFATHFWGLPIDISELKKRINDPFIYIIEDAAQAMGSSFKNKPVGTFGDIGIFSLSRGKALSAGEGGIIITDNKKVANSIHSVLEGVSEYSSIQIAKLILTNLVLSICINPWIFWLPKMLPFLKLGETLFEPDFPLLKLNGFQAGLLRNWRKKLICLLNDRALRGALYKEQLKQCNNIELFAPYWDNEKVSCIRYPIIVKNRALREKLLFESNRQGLGISPTYPDTVNSIKEINVSLNLSSENAHYLINHIVTLPCHPLVTKKDIENIVSLIKDID